MESRIVTMEDYGLSAIFAGTSKSTVLELNKDFIAEILGIKFLSFDENANRVKAERRR
jgi:hypothetical protein